MCFDKTTRHENPPAQPPQPEGFAVPQPEEKVYITSERLLDGTTRVTFSDESLLTFYAMAKLGKTLLDGKSTSALVDAISLGSFLRMAFVNTPALNKAMNVVGTATEAALVASPVLDEQFDAVISNLVTLGRSINAAAPEEADGGFGAFLSSLGIKV